MGRTGPDCDGRSAGGRHKGARGPADQRTGARPDRSGTEQRWAGADAAGSSLWTEAHGSWESWYLADERGRLLGSGTTSHGEGPSGFWSFVGANLDITRATYLEDAMVVTTYRLR